MDEDEAFAALSRLLGGAVGDDCFAFAAQGRTWALSCDMLFEGTDLPVGMGPEDWGWRAMAATISDLASAGTVPRYLLLAVGLPEPLSGLVPAIARGAKACCDAHGCRYVGGDLSRADRVVLSSSGLGEGGRVPGRGGARAGDVLCVTGEMGSACLGRLCLGAGVEAPERVAFLRPRIRVGSALAIGALASASMDISDGLARSVRLLAKRSGVGAEVELERVPRSPRAEELCERLGASLEEAVLGGGDELESLLAVPPRRLARARREVEGLAVVGRVTGRRGRCELVREGGRGPLPMAGWST